MKTRQDSPPASCPAATGLFPGHVRDTTIHPGRSKDRVVRLEPFFAKAPITPHPAAKPGVAPQAARLAGRAAAAARSNRTATRFDTPDSSWVTP